MAGWVNPVGLMIGTVGTIDGRLDILFNGCHVNGWLSGCVLLVTSKVGQIEFSS